MSRPVTLSVLKQGIQRLREKGTADPQTLYDLVDGYVTIDGGVTQRPGTALAFTLPAGTLGMCAHEGDLVVFSTSPKACPAGTRCEVLTHPFFPSQGLTYIWFAAPFLGYLYVAAEFENGDVYHYWLQAATKWEASTTYMDGQIIVPSTPNGLGYRAHRVLPKYPDWVPGMEVVLGTKVEPTTPNGYYYEVTALSEAAGVGTPGGSPNPTGPSTPPGDGGPSPSGPSPGEVFAVTGTPPDGYALYPYILMPGDCFNVTGGYWDANAYGYVAHGVNVSGRTPMSENFRVYGMSLTAGTSASNMYFDASSPEVGGGGFATVTDSVTFAASPAFALRDNRFRTPYGDKLVDTTPPFTTYDMGAAQPIYTPGFTTGKPHVEFVVTGSTQPFLVGFNAAKGDLTDASHSVNLATGGANMAFYTASTPGTYAAEIDAATGNWEVFKLGTGSVASGTLALPGGNQYRVVLASEYVQQYRLKLNCGNEAFAIAPTAGFSGLPFVAPTSIPVSWGYCTPINGISFTGNGEDGSNYGIDGAALRISFGTISKSGGQWRFECRRFDGSRIGITKIGADIAVGSLGAPGTVDSCGYDVYEQKIYWCFGGVAGSISAPIIYGSTGFIIVATDFAAGTVKFCVEDAGTNIVTVLYTVTGLPAGTYLPSEGGRAVNCVINASPVGPVGYLDWTT